MVRLIVSIGGSFCTSVREKSFGNAISTAIQSKVTNCGGSCACVTSKTCELHFDFGYCVNDGKRWDMRKNRSNTYHPLVVLIVRTPAPFRRVGSCKEGGYETEWFYTYTQ